MGLVVESIGIYEQVLLDTPELDGQKKETIIEAIELLKKEIGELEKEDVEHLTAEDISLIKTAMPLDEDPMNIADSASAFKELGLHEDAIFEYERLFDLDYPLAEFIPQLVESYFKIHSAAEIIQKIKTMIQEKAFSDSKKAEIAFMLGLEMENKDHKDHALELYQSAQDADPENEEIQNRLLLIKSGFSTGSKYDYLLNQKLVTTEKLKKALELSKKTKKSVEFILTDQFKIKKEDVGESLALFYDCPFKSYDPECTIQPELLTNLKKSFLLNDVWLPFAWDKQIVEVMIDDPRNLAKTDNIKTLLGSKINFSVAIKEDIEAFIKGCFDSKKEREDEASEMEGEDFDLIPDISFEEEDEGEDEYDEGEEASGQVVKLVDQVLVAAYRKNASDIHIEPSPVSKATSIRFRMDGVCQEYIQVPNALARGILSRIKIMGGLDIAERRLPQDGKIKFKRKGVPAFELRVATLPTAGGYEDAVMRILAKAGAMALDQMGLIERNLEILEKIISQPYGLVLVVGPTGSGKTTSLHAALGHINKPSIKIWTAEDPVEITQGGLRQVEAKPKIGLDFSRIMRAFLRADPDVIMIGEMRDEETASIGIEASLTGHLVFSTLHTNSAPETVTRLLDMGLNPLNFSDAFLGVMAQRLARKVCDSCKESYHPSEGEFEEIVGDYGKEYFNNSGIEYTPELTLYRPVGCDECSGVGYKGRLGIHELMEGTPEIKRMIKKQASAEMLFEQAMKEGMTTLKQDGIIKVFQRVTDIMEIRRIVVN
ncbi:MAG: Flp pilus assembly complex ATPase component TadA [Deltaproteobacteria bacterium]|nr:Flp pilus assembly complex ATPase component TadA [Deltaproteobacteria bacterium]